jgi:uncharacterized membrane protein YeaQ/YmgE (transglycosylase-associated protein family)
MTIETLVVWVVVGGIAGLVADWLVPRISLGLVEAIVIGILGAFLGGWLFGVLGVNVGGGLAGTIFVAIIGAVLLLLLVRAISRMPRRA